MKFKIKGQAEVEELVTEVQVKADGNGVPTVYVKVNGGDWWDALKFSAINERGHEELVVTRTRGIKDYNIRTQKSRIKVIDG